MPGNGHGEKLDRLHEQAIAALLEYPTVKKAAAAVGICSKTLSAWLRQPEFQREYRQRRRELVEVALTRLQRSTQKAVTALRRNLTCGIPGVEIKAAVAIIGQATEAIGTFDALAQLEALERKIDGKDCRQDETGDTSLSEERMQGGLQTQSGAG